MPAWIWWCVVGLNVVTFFMFGWDKRRARRGGRRVPERTLLFASWITGCLGGWLAIRTFRHKTQKVPFRRWMVLVTVLNPLWALVWWQFAP